ncbi:MAG: sugar phosphate isomerase/epimerase [Lacunisphaera sp.]|nr:sugar phosphate isomerase/epimerase [Lacunisphaera sp.]
MRLGVRAHDFGKLPIDDLAAQIARHGLDCIQLAPPKAIAGFDADAGRLSPGFAGHVREAFARHGIAIAVLGCYINLGDPDDARQRPQLDRFKEYLRFARDFGCSLVGTETGSVNADFSWHPDNHGEAAFQTVLGRVRELVREAEKFGVFVGVEGVERYVISSPRRLRRLLDEVDSPNLQVIFDPVNLLCAKNHDRQDEVVAEALALLSDRICIVHAKDFRMAGESFEEVPAGGGVLRYAPVMRWIREHKPWVHVLLENTAPATIAGTVAFMQDAWRKA